MLSTRSDRERREREAEEARVERDGVAPTPPRPGGVDSLLVYASLRAARILIRDAAGQITLAGFAASPDDLESAAVEELRQYAAGLIAIEEAVTRTSIEYRTNIETALALARDVVAETEADRG